MRLLIISNSTNAGETYLHYPKNNIRDFLGYKPVTALFIPYAAVTFSYDDYEKKVNDSFNEIGHKVISIHRFDNAIEAVEKAEAIVVGGGNTWKLLKMIRDNSLINIVKQKISKGMPYIGWSAGANMACPTIKTTNDMAIVEPDSFQAFNLIPFQINPHYLDVNPEGHAGETREQRIEEFIVENPNIFVAGLREGTMLKIENDAIKLIGKRKMRVFKKGERTAEYGENDDISFLLK